MSLKDRLNINNDKKKTEKVFGNDTKKNDVFKNILTGSENILLCCPINLSTHLAINFIGNELSDNLRIVAIGHNINFQKQELVKFEPEPKESRKNLIKTAISLNADKILLQKFEGEEAVEIFKYINSNIKNIITALHASTPEKALLQAEINLYQSGVTIPHELLSKMISSFVDKIVMMNSDCCIEKIFEVKESDKNSYKISEVLFEPLKISEIKKDFTGFEINSINNDVNEVLSDSFIQPKTAKNSPKNLLAKKLKRNKLNI